MEGAENRILLRAKDVVPGDNGRRNRAYSNIKRTRSARINPRKRDAGLIRDFSMKHKHTMISVSGKDRVGSDSSNSVSLANGEVVDAGDRTPPISPVDIFEPQSLPLSGGAENVGQPAEYSKHEEVFDAELFARCSRCCKVIEDSTAVQFEDNLYHTSCFKCAQCGEVVELTGQQMLVLDGSPLCMACSPTCWSCKNKITESHMKVLDQDFHEDCLKCVRCDKPLKDSLKIYASDKSPCCAACTLPVFERLVPSPRPPPRARLEYHSFHQHGRVSVALENCTPPTRSVTPDPSIMKRLSRSDPTLDTYDSCGRSSVYNLSLVAQQDQASISASSLSAILHDELGLSLMVNYCTREYCIELLMLWLDVEHFRGFDGDQEDLTLMAQHLVLKYIAYAADMPVCLPQAIERKILTAIETKATPDMFDEAQKHVFGIMEETIHKRFLFSDDGLKYLESLVRKDIEKRRRSRDILSSDFSEVQLKAVVTNFDKRHAGSKYYVYQIKVTMADEQYTIYRRYSEFHSLHQKLRSSFPRQRLPALPRKILFGRSQVRAVAQQRMTELQRYLKELLLQMPSKVVSSPALLTFLQQTASDMEDEMFDKKVQRNSVQAI